MMKPERPKIATTVVDYNELRRAVLAYLSECDNPVPDYNYRKTLRDRLRKLVGASPAADGR